MVTAHKRRETVPEGWKDLRRSRLQVRMRGLRARWGLEGVDRVYMDLAGKVVVGVKVCVKIGSKVCSEDGFKSGF